MQTISTKKGKRETSIFYKLLEMQKGYDKKYKDVIKEGIIKEFTCRIRKNKNSSSFRLSDLSDNEYRMLLEEMQSHVVQDFSKEELLSAEMRKKITHKIFLKLGKLGVTTVNGYGDVNYHIKRLKGFGGRIIPEIKTDELDELYKAVCSYVDFYKKEQEEVKRLAMMN